MKRAYIAAALLILLTVGCSFLSWRLSAVTGRLSQEVAAVESAVRNGAGDQAARSLETLLQSWERERAFLVALTGRTNCEPIETARAAVPVWHEDGDYGELLAALSQLAAHVSELWELQAPKLTNLF